MVLEFTLLGSVGARRLGTTIDLGGPKQRALAVFLLLRSPDVASAYDCIEAVWGADAPEGAIRSLRTYVSNLRRVLAPEIELESLGNGYRMVRRDVEVDVDRIGELLEEGRHHTNPRLGFQVLSKAADLWTGPPLSELTDHAWVAAECARFERMRAELTAERFEAGIEAGEHRALLPQLEAAVARQPLDERLAGLLMLTLYRAGRQVEALRLCQGIREHLREEFGVDPTPQLIDLERRILSHDPTLRATDSPTNLPSPTTSFVGRTSELAELAGVVGGARLVTLVGPGGVGKSRLAIEAGHLLRRRFKDGVWLCNLTAAVGPEAVDDVIGAAVGVQARGDVSRLDAALGVLRDASALLIVDNCEHVLAKTSAALLRLLTGCPGLTVLATSRAPLRLEGERVWEVSPLAAPDEKSLGEDAESAAMWPGIRLLLDRAPATFEFDDSRVAAVARLVRRLDGLPLALEVAAARLRSNTPEEILADLEDPGALASVVVDEQNGRRTLERMVERSFMSLADGLRPVFAGLGVFVGDFGVADAAAIAGLDRASAREALDGLTECSLVVANVSGPSTRFRLLETMRTFALDRLEVPEVSDLRSRHARHFAVVAEAEAVRLNGAAEAAAVDVLSDAFDDLRAAFNWAVERDLDAATRLVAHLPDYAYWREGFEVAEWASSCLDHSRVVQLDRALCGAAARGAWNLGRFREASAYARLGITGDTTPIVARSGRPGSVLADIALYEGRAVEALAFYEGMLAEARADDDAVAASWALYYVSVIQTVLGIPGASAAADECRVVADELNNPTARCYALYAQALVCKHADPVRSEALFTAASREAGTVSNSWFGGIALTEVASIKAVRADPSEAIASFGAVIDLWDRLGERTQMRLAWRYLLRALARAERFEEAAVVIGGLDAVTGSALTRPPASVVEAVRGSLGHDRYVRATVQGAVMSHPELVAHVRRTIRAG